MQRRQFLTLGAVAAAEARAAGRPNILFLFTDDQRFDTIRALGNPDIHTPSMDSLVRRGVSYTRACIMGSTVPAVCAPSRAMLLTGQSLFHVNDSIVAPQASRRPARPFHLFPELLRRAGYDTFGTGKWHNPEKLYARCFSEGATIMFGGMSDHLQVPIADFDRSGEYPKRNRYTAGRFSSELFTDSAIDFLRSRTGARPFFAFVSYTSPHDPRMAPKRYADLYPPEKIALPKNFMPEHPFDNGELRIRDEMLAPFPRTPEVVRQHIAAYYAMVTEVDAQIGRLLAALEETGRAEDTVVVFAGDNGLAVGQHGLMGKQNLYDHSIRVPLVMAGPGLPAGRKVDSLCYLSDLAPTICKLAGVPVPETMEAASLLPLARGPRAQSRESVLLAYRHSQRAIRTADWKLVRYNVDGRHTTQLFHVAHDPWELKNLAADPRQAKRIRQLRSELQDWMRRTGDPHAIHYSE